MSDLESLLSRLKVLNGDIKDIIKQSKYDMYDDLSGLNIDYDNPEELLLLDEIRGIAQKLSDVSGDIEYLSKPIKSTGKLFKNSNGKYEMDNHYKTYSCGHTIEVYLYDEFSERYSWVISSVEFNKDYYIVGHKNVPMEGLKARVR